MDDVEKIRALVKSWIADPDIDVIITTGGTGFTERDVTPEATRAILERDAPGIAEAIRQKIFDPFFTTKGPHKGTGMGLAMVYGCVTHHQGWLDVKSQVGQGTEFTVFLPKARKGKKVGER